MSEKHEPAPNSGGPSPPSPPTSGAASPGKPRMVRMLFKPGTSPAIIVAAVRETLRKAAAKASPSSRR